MTVPTLSRPWISETDLLTHEECVEVRQGLDDLREFWILRHPSAPFYTLGASNYFDISFNPLLPYYRFAARFNPILQRRLGWLYERLANRLAEYLGEPVTYREGLALPGFHIFLSDKSFESAADLTHREWFRAKGNADVVGNAIHCDTAHLVVDFGDRAGFDFEHPVSITLPIVLPSSGGGLNYWDFGAERTEGLPDDALRAMLLSGEKHYYPYREGAVIIHSGMRYHQMARMADVRPTDERITLQGHGVRCNGTWQLFW